MVLKYYQTVLNTTKFQNQVPFGCGVNRSIQGVAFVSDVNEMDVGLHGWGSTHGTPVMY